MEFPSNAYLNVHKLEVIHVIRWTKYRFGSPEVDLLPTSIKLLSSVTYYEDTKVDPDSALALTDFVHLARSQGHHVAEDENFPDIWVFDLGGAGSSTAQRTDFAALADQNPLHRIAFGHLRATDLMSESTSSTTEVTHTKNPIVTQNLLSTYQSSNIEAFARNQLKSDTNLSGNGAIHKVKTDNDFQETNGLYLKFITAVKKSLGYHLTVKQNYLPLGNFSFIHQTHSIDVLERDSGAGISLDRFRISCCQLRVQWSVSGVLTMSCFMPSTLHLQSIFDTVFTGCVDPAGAEIWLSPSGKRGVYCGAELLSQSIQPIKASATQPSQCVQTIRPTSSSETWKSSIVKHLANQGFTASLQDIWVRVRVKLLLNNKYDESLPNDVTTQEVIILWPSKLCSRRLDGGEHEHNEMETPDGSAAWISDPLTAAETWMMGKVERAKCEETKRQEKITSIARLKEVQDAEDEETMCDAYYRTNQYIEAQDISGIYPTPPDGFPSHNSEPQSSHDVQISPHTNRDIDGDKLDNVSQRQILLASATDLDTQAMNPDYDADKDDDLFGDMDTEMFASHGLTDADFSFFDDPTFDMIDEVVDQTHTGNLLDTTAPGIPPAPQPAVDFVTHGQQQPSFSADIIRAGSIEASSSVIQGSLPQSTTLFDVDTDMSAPLESNWLESQSMLKKMNPQSTTLADERSRSASQTQLDQDKQRSDAFTDVTWVKHDSISNFDCGAQHRKSSVFDTVMFDTDLDSDKKYIDTGRFGFDIDTVLVNVGGNADPSRVDSNSSLLPQLNLPNIPKEAGIPGDGSFSDTEVDSTDEESSYSEKLFIPGTPQSQTIDPNREISKKRKRDNSVELDSLGASPSSGEITASMHSLDTKMVSVLIKDLVTPSTEFDDSYTWKHYTIFTQGLEGADPKMYVGHDKHFIEIAQVLADQLTSNLSIAKDGNFDFNNAEPPVFVSVSDDPLSDVVLDVFPSAVRCDLRTFASIGNRGLGNVLDTNPNIRSATRRQESLSHQPNATSVASQIINLLPPRITVQRADTALELFPAAVQFWEELGLNPCHGSKDLDAYAIYPAGDAIQRGIEIFMDLTGNTYQRCGFGQHNVGSGLQGHPNGLVSVPAPNGDAWQMMENIRSACIQLGTQLSSKIASGTSIVIYLINPFSDPKMLPHLCAAFLKIHDACTTSMEAHYHQLRPDIVLQIIPLECVRCAETIAIPSPSVYTRVAFMVYDRIKKNSFSSQETSRYHCAASMQLAKSLPKVVNFRLAPDPPISLMDSEKSLHVSYAWSDSDTWLTAAFTDRQGILQWRASYCVSGEDKLWHSLSTIFEEVVSIVADMLKPEVRWWLYIAKIGRVHKKEFDAWCTCTKKWPQMTLTLTEIDPSPSFQILGPARDRQRSDLELHTYESHNSPAPPGMGYDHDVNVKLVEVADESWGIIAMNDESKPVIADEGSPSLATGYLVKRLGPRDEDGFTTMQVNIVRGQRPYDVLLKELLETYRSLGTLARVRGITDPISSLLPWHIAIAQKANTGLNALMRYEPE